MALEADADIERIKNQIFLKEKKKKQSLGKRK